MTLAYNEIKAGRAYKLTGNTYAHKSTIHAIGASWDKDEKVWNLDLSGHSKTSVSRISSDIFKLTRGGVKFEEAE